MTYRHRGLTNADVFLASYPRSGNTWLKSLIASCLFGEALENFSDRVNPVIPMVGFHRGVQPLLQRSGRIIKTHETFRSEYGRAIWIVRDPRDVALSEYKLEVRSHRYFGSFEEFLNRFTGQRGAGAVDWHGHTSSWADCPLAGTGHLLTIRFEELLANTGEQLRRVLEFLDVNFDDAIVERALSQNSLQSMAQRHATYDRTLGKSIKPGIPAVNKGMSGGWREQLSEEAVIAIESAFGETMARMGYFRCQS